MSSICKVGSWFWSRFKRYNESLLESNQKAVLASQAASQWLGLRLQLMGVAIITGVGMAAVIQHQFDAADPGMTLPFFVLCCGC